MVHKKKLYFLLLDKVDDAIIIDLIEREGMNGLKSCIKYLYAIICLRIYNKAKEKQ